MKLVRKLRLKPYDHVVLAEFCIDHGVLDEATREMAYADRVRPKERAFAAMIRGRLASAAQTGGPDEKDADVLARLAIADAKAGRARQAKERLGLLTTRYARTTAAQGPHPTNIDKLIRDPNAVLQQ